MKLPDVLDNSKNFVFSNWSNEDFKGVWAKEEFLIKAGEVKEFPMYLAYNFCKHFVDREMEKAGKGAFTGDDNAREPFEQKTIAEITAGTDSPALKAIKEAIKKEVEEVKSEATITVEEKTEEPKKAKKGKKKTEVKEEPIEDKKEEEFPDLK